MERRSTRRIPTLRDLQLLRRTGALVLSLLPLAAIAAPAAAQHETLRTGHFPNITHVQALVAQQGWAFAWRSLMAAEIYVTILTGFGLGHLLHYGRELSAMEQVIGVMLVIVLIGLLADKILFSPWERFLHKRWGTGLKLR